MRRGNGEGSIVKRKDGTWMGVITIGRDMDGKIKRQSIYARTRKEVAEKMQKMLNDIQTGLFVEPNKVTLGNWLNAWLVEYKKNNLKATTYASYETNIRVHILPKIGGILLKNLTTHHIQRMENDIYDNGKVSTSLIIKIHNILHCSLEQAVKNQLVIRNVADNVVLPKHRQKDIRILTLEEQARLLSVLETEASGKMFRTYLMTGLRLGELLALTWDDIDLKKKVISVNKNLAVVMNHDDDKDKKKTKMIVQDSTKTKSGMRTVPMPNSLVVMLAQHKDNQQGEIKLMDGVYEHKNLVFCTATGNHYNPRNMQEKFTRIVQKSEIQGATIHSLRHTYATRLFELGVSAKVVSELLGHSSIVQTLNTYTHVMPEMKHEAVQKLDLVANM